MEKESNSNSNMPPTSPSPWLGGSGGVDVDYCMRYQEARYALSAINMDTTQAEADSGGSGGSGVYVCDQLETSWGQRVECGIQVTFYWRPLIE